MENYVKLRKDWSNDLQFLYFWIYFNGLHAIYMTQRTKNEILEK